MVAEPAGPTPILACSGRAIRPPARLVDGDLLARYRPLADPRARPRERRDLLLRRHRPDQRVHDRVPDPEPRPLAARGRGALVGVRPRLQRAAGEGGSQACLASRLEPLLADAARTDGPDGAVRAGRALGPTAVPPGRSAADGHAGANPLPDRRAAR